MIKYAVLTVLLVLLLASSPSAGLVVDSINYKIEIGDMAGSPGSIVRMPVKFKNVEPIGSFFIRIEYDSSMIKPIKIDSVSSVVYDSLELSGRGLNLVYESSPGDTVSNLNAYHRLNYEYDSTSIYFLFTPAFIDESLYLESETGDPSIICNLLFRIAENAEAGQISLVKVADQIGTEPSSLYNQLADTLGNVIYFSEPGPVYDTAVLTVGEILCGDIDFNGTINLLDVINMVQILYIDATPSESLRITDVNGDSIFNIIDIIYLIHYLYSGGPAPNCP